MSEVANIVPHAAHDAQPGAQAPAATRAVSRLRYIDALRAIAALLVVWLHVTQSYAKIDGAGMVDGRWLASVAQDFDIGRMGVAMFFVISGFVIPFSLRMDRPAPIGTFLIKRFFRIYPAYWLSIPFSAFAAWWLWGRPFGVGDFLVNFTLLQDVVGAKPASGVYWTLLVEIAFYLLCVVLVLANSLFNPVRIGVLALVLALAHSAGAFALWLGLPLSRPLVFFPLHLSLMLFGTLYRYCVFERSASLPARRLLRALTGFLLVILPAGAIWALGPYNNYVVSVALGLLLFIVGTRWLRIESRLTDWLGGISYSIYLFHLPVYYPIYWWLLQQPAGSWWRAQHIGVYLAVSTALTMVVAAGVHRFVEQPGIRAGRRCAAWWAARHGGGTRASNPMDSDRVGSVA